MGQHEYHMVCKRQNSEFTDERYGMQEVTINMDLEKEGKEIWVEIYSPSHPDAVVFVSEMQIMIQRYERYCNV